MFHLLRSIIYIVVLGGAGIDDLSTCLPDLYVELEEVSDMLDRLGALCSHACPLVNCRRNPGIRVYRFL